MEKRTNNSHRKGEVINKFTLGEKELEGKVAQFLYDRGSYTIVDVVEEQQNIIYKSRNAQEAYMKWNVYIGRKKERVQRGKEKEQEVK